MTWRERAREAAEARLRGLMAAGPSTRESAVSGPDDSSSDDAGAEDVAESVRIRTGPWSGAAVRGLLVLTVLAVGAAAYLMWQAQPREVVAAPEVLAQGEPITGNLPADPITGGLPAEATGAAPPSMPDPTVPPAQQPVSSPDVIVHVAGQVARPGLVRLPGGSRVADAVEAAGGVTRPRAAESVNLARLVVDGEQIYVGGGGGGAGGAESPRVGAGADSANSPLDLNAATAEQFDALPGVGPVIAGRIVEWRTLHGRFRSVEELAEVSGIGEAILASLRPLVRV